MSLLNIVHSTNSLSPMASDYLNSGNEASVFHMPRWNDLIHEHYGHDWQAWTASRSGNVVGVLVVTEIRAWGRRKAISLPYQFHVGGPVASDPDVSASLLREALVWLDAHGLDDLEIRSEQPRPELIEAGLTPARTGLVTGPVNLTDLDFRKIRRGHRRYIRRAEDEGLSVSTEATSDDWHWFKHEYLRQQKKLGSPQASPLFFDRMRARLGDGARLACAWWEGRRLGGVATVEDSHTVYARWGAYAGSAAQRLHAGKSLIWHSMRAAAGRGSTIFQLGITWEGDQGLIHLKEGFGARITPVVAYARKEPGAPPGDYFSRFKLAKRVWRLMPDRMSWLLGDAVTRWIC